MLVAGLENVLLVPAAAILVVAIAILLIRKTGSMLSVMENGMSSHTMKPMVESIALVTTRMGRRTAERRRKIT